MRASAMHAVTASSRAADYLRLIRFQHTLFALPFAYVGMLLAAGGWPGWTTFLWITLAMAGARTAAMAVNRVVDARIDAANPRTAEREIPAGVVTPRGALTLGAVGMIAFVAAGWALNPLTLALLPVATLFMVAYPYTKRFTWACHAFLGVTIGASAAGGWIAVTGSFDPVAWWLWLGVGAWIAGFDVVYAMLDERFDREHGVHSVPARFGADAARRVAAGAHALAWAALAVVAWRSGFGAAGWIGLALVAAAFVHQHRLVARHGAAVALRAFDANLWIGTLVLAAVVLDLATRG